MRADDVVSERTRRDLDALEHMPRGLRECVHEFGSQIVNQMVAFGITDPVKIRQIVQTCWLGARQPNQRTGGQDSRGDRRQSVVADQLDWILIQAGSPVSAATIMRMLWLNGMVIVTREPSLAMIERSMATVSTFEEAITKREKHRRRLRAAIDAGARHLWPHLYREADRKRAEATALKAEIEGSAA